MEHGLQRDANADGDSTCTTHTVKHVHLHYNCNKDTVQGQNAASRHSYDTVNKPTTAFLRTCFGYAAQYHAEHDVHFHGRSSSGGRLLKAS